MRFKWLALAVAALAAVVAGWWLASPWWTLRAMRDAAAAHDEKTLSAHVDYPALRANLNAQMKRQMVGKGETGGTGSVVNVVTAMISEPLIDAAITPEKVEVMFAADDLQKGAESKAEASTVLLSRLPSDCERPIVERDGLNQFQVYGRKTPAAKMVFRRDGLGWKLAAVTLPEDHLATLRHTN
jgi:hypothetical protein